MSAYVNLTEAGILTDLRALLLNYLPAGVEVIKAQDNRVSEPQGPDFVVMTPTWRGRLSTNRDSFTDCAFIGTTDGTLLTVSLMLIGAIGPSSLSIVPTFPLPLAFFGIGVPDGSLITGQQSGTPGGVGIYNITPSQQTSAAAIGSFVMGQSAIDGGSQAPIGTFTIGQDAIDGTRGALLACGTNGMLQPTHVAVQLDVHGPNSPDNSQIITTLMRDEAAYDFMAALGNGVFPLYADEGKQIPFLNAEQQIEERWVVEANLQANITTLIPQQFAQAVTVVLKDVDVVFPPS